MFCRLFVTLLCLLCSQSLFIEMLRAVKPPQASGNDALAVVPCQQPNLQNTEAALVAPGNLVPEEEEEPSPLLKLPDEILGLIFEFYCMEGDDDVYLPEVVQWRKVCNKLRRVYDQNIFWLIKEVKLPSVAALESFMTPNYLGVRPVDNFSGKIQLYHAAANDLLQKQVSNAQATSAQEVVAAAPVATVVEAAAEEAESTPPTLANIKEALEASNKRGNSLHLCLPNQADNTTLTGSAPFATLLPFTSLAPEGDQIVQVETLNLFEQLTELSLMMPSLPSIEVLRPLQQLRTLSLTNCHRLTTLNGIGAFQSLEKLVIDSSDWLSSLGDVGQSNTLQHVKLFNLPLLANIEALSLLQSLQKLHLQGVPALPNIDNFLKCPRLRELSLIELKLPKVPFLTAPTHLKILEMSRLENLDDTLKVTAPNLQEINIRSCHVEKIIFPNCVENAFKPRAQEIRTLDISNCQHLKQVVGLNNCKDLTQLSLKENPVLETCGPCASLEHLNLKLCPQLRPTASWLQVKRLTLHNRVLPIFDPVPQQQTLERLDLKEEVTRDPELLAKLAQLTSVNCLMLSSIPQNIAAIKSLCKAQHITLWLDEGWDGISPLSLRDEALNEDPAAL